MPWCVVPYTLQQAKTLRTNQIDEKSEFSPSEEKYEQITEKQSLISLSLSISDSEEEKYQLKSSKKEIELGNKQKSLSQKICEFYKISKIPTILLINQKGNVLQPFQRKKFDPRSDIVRKGILCFKQWQLLNLRPLLGTSLFVKGEENQIIQKKVEKLIEPSVEIIMLYFTSYSNTRCQSFLSKLLGFYTKVNSLKHQLQIIQIYKEIDNEEYQQSLQEVPWPAFPFQDQRNVHFLKIFQINENKDLEVPQIFLLNNQFKYIDLQRNLIRDVQKYGFNIWQQWTSSLNENQNQEIKTCCNVF